MKDQLQQENRNVSANVCPGEMPRFWNRSSIFFANLLSIFYGNKGETETLRQQVGGLETYGGRLIPIIDLLFKGGDNLLVLEVPPDEMLLRHYSRELGLHIPKVEILPHKLYNNICGNHATGDDVDEVIERIKNHPAQWIDGFVTDKMLVDVAAFLDKKTTSTPNGSRAGNNKFLLHQNLADKGLPVFETVTAASYEDIFPCLRELSDKGFSKAVIKSQVGASGIGLLKVFTDVEQTFDVPDYFFQEGPCLVQGWLDDSVQGVKHIGSPSVQMFLDDNSVNLYDITEQILNSDSIHEGNVAPPSYVNSQNDIKNELLEQGEEAGKWLHEQGYRGTASADFLVVDRVGSTQVIMCEINARVTGATYPSVLARNFMPMGAWFMRNIRFQPSIRSERLMELLEKAGFFYRPGDKDGIIPINFNEAEEGLVHKGQFLCLGAEMKDCVEKLEQIITIFPMELDYDRD